MDLFIKELEDFLNFDIIALQEIHTVEVNAADPMEYDRHDVCIRYFDGHGLIICKPARGAPSVMCDPES